MGRNVAVVVFALAGLFAAAGQAQTSRPSVEDLLKEAGVALGAQDFAKAELWVREVIATFPNDPRGGLALISVLERANKTAEALRVAREYQVRYRNDADYHSLVGRVLVRADRIPEALAEYDLGIQYATRPAQKAAIYAMKGDAHRFRDEWTDALAAYLSAKQIVAQPIVGLAMTYGELGRFDEEVREYRALLALAPGNAAVLNNLAYSFAERGQNLEEAEVLARRVVAAVPGSAALLDTLGWVHFKRGQLEQAEAELVRATQMEDGNSSAHWEHLGAAMDARAVWTESRRELRDLLKREPTGRTVARVKELLKEIH